jgi:polyisoprenyl-teichoic acid--peptidoglycan teichoic acid transferase
VVLRFPPAAPDNGEAEPPEPSAPERRAWLGGFALGLLALLALAVVFGVLLAVAAGAPPRTVLLVGLDERPDEQQRGVPGHTDTIAVLALAPPGSATLISFPRDLWVSIPGHGEQRLNVAYPLGVQASGAAGGAALLGRTLAAEFGLAPDRWARVDFRGFADLVDALGGVEVTVPRALVDDHYPTEDYGTRRLEIPAGRQQFDGAMALAYVRTRAPDSDFGRIGRQQEMLVALRERALSPEGLVRLPGALLALARSVTSDLSARETLALLRTLALLPRDRLQPLVIGPDLAPPRVGPGGAAILVPETAAIRQLLANRLNAR